MARDAGNIFAWMMSVVRECRVEAPLWRSVQLQLPVLMDRKAARATTFSTSLVGIVTAPQMTAPSRKTTMRAALDNFTKLLV